MGFFVSNHAVKKRKKSEETEVSIALLHQLGCKICPLSNQEGLCHPDMKPSGSKRPLVYMLGEFPSISEDKHGTHFAGDVGSVLLDRIPKDFRDSVRFNNVVRTRPPKGRNPTRTEIEACRKSVIADIEKYQPVVIVGFGNIVLNWIMNLGGGITKWRGRRIPVRIGKHVCWFYPMQHPQDILKSRRYTPRSKSHYGSQDELAFMLDLNRVFSEVENLPKPIVHTKEYALANISYVTGENGEDDIETIRRHLEEAVKQKLVGVDYETNGLRPYNEGRRILTAGISTKKGSFSFPINHSKAKWTSKQKGIVNELWRSFLADAEGRKIVHHLTFELEWTGYFYGKEYVRIGKWEDTISQAYVLDERQGVLSLEHLCFQYFGINVKAIDSLDRANLDKCAVEDVLRYNAMDAKYHRLLYIKQNQRLKEEGLHKVYKQHLRRVPTMALTQLAGVPVSQDIVSKFYKLYTKRLKKVEDKIARLPEAKKFRRQSGNDFRPSANEDVRFVLKNILGYKAETVDEAVLSKIKHPIPRLVLRWRKTNKLLSTYVLPMRPDSPNMYPDGHLHPTINTVKTDTTRTSSGDPNIQNYPSRVNKEVREQVKVNSDEVLIAVDYGSIQARNVAMESLDAALIKAFWERYDIHADWMERISKKYPAWLDGGPKILQDKVLRRKYRNMAKNEFVFPSFFGAQPKSLATYLNIPENIAHALNDAFWDEFPDIKGWHERIISNYESTGYVTGCSGYRRHAPISPNQLINAPIQADEAAIVCDAMARLSEKDHDKYQAILMVHDDLTFRVPKKKIDEYMEFIIPTMVNTPFKWAQVVPISVEVSIGQDWFNLKPAGEYYSDLWKPGMFKNREKESG